MYSPSSHVASLVLPSLSGLGWSEAFAEHITEEEKTAGLRPARIASVYSSRVELWLPDASAPYLASLRGRTLRDSPEGGVAVGDWALVASANEAADDFVVERILPRRTAFVRQAAGERSEPQAIAANIDRVLVVSSVDGDFNTRRLERYLVAIAGSGAEATIVIAKADLAKDASALLAESSKLAPTILSSARTGLGISEILAQMPHGKTVALVGSSGVGKSALVNALLGQSVQHEGAVRAHDRRGRHTTTRRVIFVVPGGGLLVDTPGMRELKPWQRDDASYEDALSTFADIADIAATCKYTNCRHAAEPGCAIIAAVTSRTLTAERVASWTKLERERAARKDRQEAFARVQEKRRAQSGAVSQRKEFASKRGR